MIEYIPARLSAIHFKLSKFEGTEQPTNEYFLVMRSAGEKGHSGVTDPEFHCDCPNRRRGKHVNDKHGQMIAKWLLQGEKPGIFNEQYEFIEREEYHDTNWIKDLAGDEPNSDASGDPDGDSEDEDGQVRG